MDSRFPRASVRERQRMVDDWTDKAATARGVVSDFRARVKDPAGLSVLDAGSGSGGLSVTFAKAGALMTGVDIEEGLSDISRRHAAVQGVSPRFMCYDGVHLPLAENSFDAAVSVSVLEHTDSPKVYLGEILRVLKPGGFLYLAFPNRLWPRETHTKLWFLTYLPAFLRPAMVKLFRRNPLKDNNLHFYGLRDLKRMIRAVNERGGGRFVVLAEAGKSISGLKALIKKIFQFFGINHRAFLPHVMLILSKEVSAAKKLKVALMTYAIDGRYAKGSARYARRLLDHLLSDERFEFFLVHFKPDDDPLYRRSREILMPQVRLPYASRFVSLLLFFFRYRNRPFDIIHWFQPRIYPLYWLAPARHIVVTAHGGGDITAPGLFVFSKQVFNFVLSRLNFAVSALIADSDFGKREIVEHYRAPPSKVHAILLGGGEDFKRLDPRESAQRIAQVYGIQSPFILDVSRLQPHKNVDSLITAYIKMRGSHPERREKLVIAGSPVFGFEKTYELARQSRFAVDISFVNYVEEKDLNALYAAAQVFVFPSLNEGFGLPVIEAMASGTPVITSNTTSLPEVAGEAGIIVPPFDTDALAREMEQVLADGTLRQSLIAKGLAHAAAFTWDKTARKTAELYLKLSF